MIFERADGYEIDTAKERLDVAQVHEWISTDAYWALGRSLELMTRAIAGSLCFGVYDAAGMQVGFCRVVTDEATFGWLCDVYIARSARGAGLGTWMSQVVKDHVLGLGLRRVVLATADAHGVYAKAGFAPLLRPERWMEVDLRPGFGPGDVPHT